MIMVWERYCNASPKPEFLQMILHTETSKLMYNWSFLFQVLHKPTLLPSTFKVLGLGELFLRF